MIFLLPLAAQTIFLMTMFDQHPFLLNFAKSVIRLLLTDDSIVFGSVIHSQQGQNRLSDYASRKNKEIASLKVLQKIRKEVITAWDFKHFLSCIGLQQICLSRSGLADNCQVKFSFSQSWMVRTVGTLLRHLRVQRTNAPFLENKVNKAIPHFFAKFTSLSLPGLITLDIKRDLSSWSQALQCTHLAWSCI